MIWFRSGSGSHQCNNNLPILHTFCCRLSHTRWQDDLDQIWFQLDCTYILRKEQQIKHCYWVHTKEPIHILQWIVLQKSVEIQYLGIPWSSLQRLKTLSNFEVRRNVIAYLRRVTIKRACCMWNRGKTHILGLLAVRHAIYRWWYHVLGPFPSLIRKQLLTFAIFIWSTLPMRRGNIANLAH